MDYMLILLARWLHILAAGLFIGVPIYLWLVQMPSMSSLDEASRIKLRDASARRWRMLVYISIAIFLATGLFNFLHVRRWHDFERSVTRQYHMLFGIKFMLALALFFVVSALAGRSASLEYFRKNAGTWIMVSVLLAVLIVMISGIMRFMPERVLY